MSIIGRTFDNLMRDFTLTGVSPGSTMEPKLYGSSPSTSFVEDLKYCCDKSMGFTLDETIEAINKLGCPEHTDAERTLSDSLAASAQAGGEAMRQLADAFAEYKKPKCSFFSRIFGRHLDKSTGKYKK